MKQDKLKLFYRRRRVLRSHSHDDEFDNSPIADLAFLLLIFFIVTSSFILRQGIFLSLPSKSASTRKVDKSKIYIITPSKNTFLVEQKTLSRDELLTSLAQKKSQEPETVVLINMKKDILYDRLIDTLSAVREVGLSKISIKSL